MTLLADLDVAVLLFTNGLEFSRPCRSGQEDVILGLHEVGGGGIMFAVLRYPAAGFWLRSVESGGIQQRGRSCGRTRARQPVFVMAVLEGCESALSA
jgi:hypothetical protein